MVDPLDVYSAMQDETPHGIFKKVILGNVIVSALNPFDQTEVQVKMLHGVPERNDEGCYLKTWSLKETLFVENINKPLFDRGYIVKVNKVEKRKESESEKLNKASDEELDKILNTPWLGFRAKVNKMTSEAPVNRLLTMARLQDKSESYTKFLEEKLIELQES
jgi:hypothetical protein